MRSPQGALGGAKTVTLSVFDAAKGKCDAATGHIPKLPTEEEGLQTFELSSSGCPAGVAWCKDITLDRDDSTKIFGVVAKNETGVLAEGCATQKIDQDPLTVSIKVHLANVEKCCGDATLQAGEQCEVAATTGQCGGIAPTEICDASCQTTEMQLANESSMPLLTQGGAGKSELTMTFANGQGELLGGLRAAYTSNSSDASGMSDINMRLLNKDLMTIESPFPFSHQLRVPLLCADTGGPGVTREQRSPSIAVVSSLRTAVVYASNEDTATTFEVFLSAQTQDGCAESKPFKVSAKTAPAENVGKPRVAGGPDGRALVIWTRAGKIRGRIWKSPADGIGNGELIPLDAETEFDLAPSTLNVKDAHIAGWSGGWVLAYAGQGAADADGIYMNTVTADGNLGTEQKVNVATAGVQDQPDVAVLKTGARMVVWRSDGDIYFQRYDPSGKEIGDQFEPLHAKDAGVQARPTVASSGEIGDFFVAAWEQGDDTIWARIVDGTNVSPFLQNSVTGQNDAFPAAYPGTIGVRRLPAVAIGGHIAIGWHDESPTTPGVYIRRFPLPKQ